MDEEEEPWIEDRDEDTPDNDEDDDPPGLDLFADPHSEFQVTFGEVTVNLSGIKGAKYPRLLPSTGLTLWKSSEWLCHYLCDHPNVVHGKCVVELGAGLGLCGISAHKLGAHRVVLTDGDTDTLANMRLNVASNRINGEGKDDNDDSIVCKQLLWGRNVEAFLERWAPEHGFDVVMGSDIFYAEDYLEPLFQTILLLLSKEPGSIFLLSYAYRSVSIGTVCAEAKRNGLEWTGPEDDADEGIYVFRRAS